MKKKSNRLSDVRKALPGKQVPPPQATTIRGGDGDDTKETFPWIDVP
jgi:hypothetical protein